MQYRTDPLRTNECYHIFTRSIAKYIIFNNDYDYLRLVEMLNLFQYKDFCYKYHMFKRLAISTQTRIINELHRNGNRSVDIIAFCIMPTHIHLVLQQLEDGGISNFMSKVLNSYSRYFNIKHDRIGPLWESRFKNKHIEDDEQLLHTTRYIHLNPVTANLVDKPEDYEYSSYNEYIMPYTRKICNLDNLMDFAPEKYKDFVDDRISYQRELKIIKKILLDYLTY